MMRIPYINMIATGENINRMRMEAGFSVREMQAGFRKEGAAYCVFGLARSNGI